MLFQLLHIGIVEFDQSGGGVLLEVFHLGRPGDREHHGRFLEQPGERHLRRLCVEPLGHPCERAAVFREIGGFSPEYRRDEDREFNLRMWRADKRGMYVDSVVGYAEIQPERLAKRYHRAWYRVTGASHARLRYLDTIDRDGRLDDHAAARGHVWWGVPGFLYRQFIVHAAAWIRKLMTGGWDDAFFDECRLRYLASYFRTRWRHESAGIRAGGVSR